MFGFYENEMKSCVSYSIFEIQMVKYRDFCRYDQVSEKLFSQQILYICSYLCKYE